MKRVLNAIIQFLLIPLGIYSQNYSTLWKQVEEANDNDLPQTAISHLRGLAERAAKAGDYGHLLKAELLTARLQSEVSPDSLLPAVRRLERCEASAQDPALKMVYDAVLSQIYSDNPLLSDDSREVSDRYRRAALADPALLAGKKSEDYVPFVVKRGASSLYGHDLLSIVGSELGAWDVLSDYYTKSGNRPAACLTTLNCLRETAPKGRQAAYLHQLDSLLDVYGDLLEAGEVAIERYRAMDNDTGSSTADKYEWLQKALARWGEWPAMVELRNKLAMLCNPFFQLHADENVSEVGLEHTIRLTQLRHIERLTMRVYSTSLKGDTSLRPESAYDYDKIKKGLTELPQHTKTLTFGPYAEYEVFSDSLQLDALPAGVYMLEFDTQPSTSVERRLFYVSGLRVLSQPMPGRRIRYAVVDATTGQPVPNAAIRLSFRRRYSEEREPETIQCDRQGEAVYTYDQERPAMVWAYTAGDESLPEMNTYGDYYFNSQTYKAEHTSIFTDRTIYRPGQTVHATAIVWREQSATDNQAVADKTVTFMLRDANRKLVAEQKASTDRFGKCSVRLTLPSGQLNGTFTVEANGQYQRLRVEEYKRPTFQVEIPDYQQAYRQGDTLHVEGQAKTYSGVPVQNARVHYTVRRRVAYWWMRYSAYWEAAYVGNGLQETVLKEADTMTDDNGAFTVDMPMILPEDIGRHTMFYHFVADAEVTDVGGETHSGTLSLPLGSRATTLSCDLPRQVRKDQLTTVTISRHNAAGQEIPGEVRYRIDSGQWRRCEANSRWAVATDQLKSGSHTLQAVCESDSLNISFVVFGLDDHRPATPTTDWFYVSDDQFPADGSAVTVQVGASDPGLRILYGIYADDRLIEQGTVRRDGGLLNRKFSYDQRYGNGLLVTFAWVKNGRGHKHEAYIRRPLPDKQLRLQWETFRDRLTPGQQEEWRLTVKAPPASAGSGGDSAADASLLAVLYDRSLDAITPHNWAFSPVNSLPRPYTHWNLASWNRLSANGYLSHAPQPLPDITFSGFDHSVYPYYARYGRVYVRGRGLSRGGRKPVEYETAAPMLRAKAYGAADMDVAEEQAVEKNAEAKAAAIPAVEPPAEESVQLRENMSETAFCYPDLRTDAEGCVTIRFTLPECLTTWRFMGVANTTDMLFGTISGEAVASKEVMVQPNMPRFIRMGDAAEITARVINTADHAVSGTARMQLIDPETEQVVFEQQQPFSVEKGQTGSATFRLRSAAISQSLLICRISAQGEGFSDGEQHYLPILPDREYVTRTVSYTQREPGVKTIDLGSLFPQGTTQRLLTVEYTNNPAWLLVQALPAIGHPNDECVVCQAASFYANAIGQHIIDQNPNAKTVFEQWSREQGAETSLMSSLEKNQELKDLVLGETPWVLDAKNEDDQKQRLADFFDDNLIDQRLQTAVGKLQKLQRADGAFAWYPGMEGSASITVTVGEMLVRLARLTGQQSDTQGMQDKVFSYLGKEMTELVERWRKQEKKVRYQSFPSFTALRWLYLCALDGRRLPDDVQKANDYLIKLLKKDIKRQTIYEKALTAVILARHQESGKAATYVRSLKEYTVYTEEMGRYYDTPRASYSWYDYKIPTEVAAIEAIRMVTPDDRQTADEMCRWLLQQKRTQAWDTPVNTVNAIYAFQNGDSRQLTTGGERAVLAVDGTELETPQATAALGYVKAAVHEPEGHVFTAEKSSAGISWGAVYAQFLQRTSEVERSGSDIIVRRELLMEGKPLSSRTGGGSIALPVGARVTVRITIDASRDLDFVQVVDHRAACMEPIRQLSGYHNGAYVSPKDYATHYFYNQLGKGRHVIETEYYIDRAGQYDTGTCNAQCAYAPEYRATAPSMRVESVE